MRTRSEFNEMQKRGDKCENKVRNHQNPHDSSLCFKKRNLQGNYHMKKAGNLRPVSRVHF